MADNVGYTPGSGASIAADEIAGVLHQRVKLSIGIDGAAADASAVAPVPTIPGHPSTKVLTNASVSFASAGDNSLVTATAAQTTRVHRLLLVFEGTTTVTFKSGATSLSGAMLFQAGQSLVLDFDGEPWFVTGTNEAFIVSLGSAVNVRGFIQYEKSA